MVGEVAAGLLLSPLLLAVVYPEPTRLLFAPFGILMLMLLSGLMTDFRSFAENKFPAFLTGAFGVVVTVGVVFYALMALGVPVLASLYLSVILSNTAIEVSAKVMMEKMPSAKVYTIVMGASFVDDILAVFLIGLVGSATLMGTVDAWELLMLSAKVLAFLFVTLVLIPPLFERVKLFNRLVTRKGREEKIVFTFTILLAFSIALAAKLVGLHEVIGAYIAGLLVGKWGSQVGPLLRRRRVYLELLDDMVPSIKAVFTPIFFGYVGVMLGSILATTEITPSIALYTLVMFGAAIIGKLVGCGLGARLSGLKGDESVLVGVAMGGRGALEFVLISLGYQYGLLTEELFTAVVGATLLTVIFTPTAYSVVRRRRG
jgi:Kef-type K+ transport system membrane component KefB